MNIHTSKCTFSLIFSSPESVKDIPFTALTFTNVQLYRQNKSNHYAIQQGLSNITTRFFFSSIQLINLHLITPHILHIFYIYSYEAKERKPLIYQPYRKVVQQKTSALFKLIFVYSSSTEPHVSTPPAFKKKKSLCFKRFKVKSPGMAPQTRVVALGCRLKLLPPPEKRATI